MAIFRQIIDNRLVEVDQDDVNEDEDLWIETPDRGTNSLNKEIILKSDVCGCHNCGRTFWPSEIKEWFNYYEGEDDDERPDDTAECPYCGSDYVAGSYDYPSKVAFAAAMAEPEFSRVILKGLKRGILEDDPDYYIERYRDKDGVWLCLYLDNLQHLPTVDEAVAYAKREFGINEEDWITIGDGLKVEDWIHLE